MARRRFAVMALGLLGCLWASGCCVNRPGGPIDPCLDGCGPSGGACPHGGDCQRNSGPIRRIANNILSCGGACGEVYWDEWLSDPPDCCDPCDQCGNWIGPRYCSRRRPLAGFVNFLKGCRGEECCDEPCDACDGEGCSVCQPNQVGAATPPPPSYYDDPLDNAPSVPKAAIPDPKAERPIQPYHPQYTRPAVYRTQR